MPSPKQILDNALQLNQTPRALITAPLLESLDTDRDFAVSQPWQEEIRRRCAEIDAGETELLDGATVIHSLKEKYGR